MVCHMGKLERLTLELGERRTAGKLEEHLVPGILYHDP
jgi:hypothetical protein